MRNPRVISAQSDTSSRIESSLAALFLVFCCALPACVEERLRAEPDAEIARDEDAASDASAPVEEDAEVDARAPVEADAGIDARAPVEDAGLDAGEGDAGICVEQQKEIDTFVANHRACANDDDCVIVGDCSHSEFQAVSRAAEAEAKALVLADRCSSQDGPGYYARCRQGACERLKSFLWCGSPIEIECPAGTTRFSGGCGSPIAATFRDGCHAACTGQGDDGPCTTGYTCQQTNINPCPSVSTPGVSTCAACGAEKWLCLPVAACQVQLSISFHNRSVARVRSDEATTLQLWLENRTDQSLTFSFEQPCHGPAVVGLGDYDLWGACLAGACTSPTSRVEITLAPREKRLWRSGLIEVKPSVCNMQGLASGKYTPTFALPYVQGANVCGPAASTLFAGSAALAP